MTAEAPVSMHSAPFADLTAHEIYSICTLRVDVFVVEQNCAYQELDGVDEHPDTVHFWFARDGRAVSTLRVLRDDGRARIGRVCTAADARGLGLSARLMTAAIEVIGNEPIVIGAQAYLEKWYAGFGFERSGPNYAEDGIPHLPMIKPAG